MGLRTYYVAGPMTGYEYFNFENFDKATYTLRKQGHTVFSPAEHDRNLLGRAKTWLPKAEDTEGPWKRWALSDVAAEDLPTLRDMLGADLAFITKTADAIYMLSGWEKSLGARAEHATAVALGHYIQYE